MKKIILIAMTTLVMLSCTAQSKPIAKNDTVNITKGSDYKAVLFKNDVGANKIVTSFKIGTGSVHYTKDRKTVVVTGIGTVRIDSNGIALFKANETYIGAWPVISYTINNGLAGNGKSANIITTSIKQKQFFGDCSWYLKRINDGIIMTYGEKIFTGQLGCEDDFYYIIIDGGGGVMIISKIAYNILK